VVTSCDPVGSFTAVQKRHYVWDEFFSVVQLGMAQFELADHVYALEKSREALDGTPGESRGDPRPRSLYAGEAKDVPPAAPSAAATSGGVRR
ncbi:MAG: hypothetical protein ACXVRP_14475, partial [Solirubrobacteraceae bacterium]